MMDDAPATSSESPKGDEPLVEGARVEVRNAFDGTWSRGFTIIAVHDGRYRLRRRSDDSELPGSFAQTDVRRERKRSMWWV